MYSFILLPIALVATEIYFEDLTAPDYEYTFFNPKDIRENFLRNRKRNSENTKKIMQLDQLSNNTIYLEDIPHYAVTKLTNNSKVNIFETEFRNLIGMKGLKYTYKRDTFWRTWRVVNFSGKLRVIWYRCENTVNFTHCDNGGYWVIEEKPPPCPYELFSMPKEDRVCAVHISQYYKVKNCNSLISLSDFTESCSNPVVTVWKVEKTFDAKVSARFPIVICGGRESCDITTLYKISADHISFRIMNSSNHVIYSRIMKQGKNYACISDCGKMDPYTTNIAIATKPLLVNLLRKTKREYSRAAYLGKKKRESRHNSLSSHKLLLHSEVPRSSLVKDEFDD